MLKVEHITKSFADKKVLSDISFQVDKGQIVALLGENGAGKSTLLRILSAFFEADSGSVSLDDLSISNQRTSYLRHIGYVQEISALYGDMNVHDFLFFEANIRNIPSADIADRVKDVVTKLQLREVLGQETETLSSEKKVSSLQKTDIRSWVRTATSAFLMTNSLSTRTESSQQKTTK